MKCRICSNHEDNLIFPIQEKQYCTRDEFEYFQCSKCKCIQIVSIPENLQKYYPDNYYSFQQLQSNKKLSFFKRVQADYLIYNKSKLLGSLFTLGYEQPKLYTWLKNLKLKKSSKVLDVGCGTGGTLHMMHQLGFENLMGIDPFIKQDYSFTENFKIYKKTIFTLNAKEKFDCIMMHHSFEHMELQMEVLEKAKLLLNETGKLLIRIPVVSDVLFKEYGVNLVSLDAPRHFYIHSVESMHLLCSKAGLLINKVDYDADVFSIWASEEYQKDICLSDEDSYARSREKSIFSKRDIKRFKKEIQKLNKNKQSDNAAFYISTA